MVARASSTSQPYALHLLGLKGLCKALDTGFSFPFAHCILIAAWATPVQFTLHDVSGFWWAPTAGYLEKATPPSGDALQWPLFLQGLWDNSVPVCSSFPEQLNPSEISRQTIQSGLQCTWYFCGCSRAELASACASHVWDDMSSVPNLDLGRACPTVGQIQ